MATVKLYLYDLPFGREANIRFTMTDLETQIQMGGTYFDSVNVPETHDSLKELDVTVDVKEFTYSYAVMEWKQKISGQLEITHKSGWWVDTYAQISNKNPVLTVHLVRDPWPSVVDKDRKRFKGLFKALPTYKAPYLPAVLADTTLEVDASKRILLPAGNRAPDTHKLSYCWIEIVTNRRVAADAEDSVLYRYGVFCGLSDMQVIPNAQINIATGTNTQNPAPTIYHIVSDIVESFHSINQNFASENILDIFISERCPYKWDVNDNGWPGIKSYDNTFNTNFITFSSGGETVKMWALGSAIPADPVTVTVEVTPEMRLNGQIHLKDTLNNLVAVLPVQLGTLNLKCRTSADTTGIVTYLYTDNNELVYTIPEGHLPFIGDAWTSYDALNRNYDRECMQINIDKANADAINNAAGGVVSGALTGALTLNPVIGVATAALNIGTTAISRGISINAENKLQAAKEQSYKVAVGNSYNTGYGFRFALFACLGGAHIDYLLPANLDSDYKASYIKTHGYPAVGEHTVDFSKGYYSGFVTAVYDRSMQGNAETLTITGIAKHLIDLINLDLNMGIRIIETKEDI